MPRRALVLIGVAVVMVTLAVLGGYLLTVGLDRADKLASVVGAFVGLLGLGLATLGLIPRQPEDSKPETMPNDAHIDPSLAIRDDAPTDLHNDISGFVQGNVVQARDIEGGITFGARPSYKRSDKVD